MSHARCLVRMPLPQVCEQADHRVHWPHLPFTKQIEYNFSTLSIYFIGFLPGQAFFLQPRLRVVRPTQSAPPLEGGGLLHSRCLVRMPPPQVFEQEDQLPKGPHRPSTA